MSTEIYLDTCVYSELLDSYEPTAYPTLLAKLDSANAKLVLSPVNIIEFLQTRDELRRERLIFLAQNICGDDLLPDIETILVHFIAERSGRADLKPFLLEAGIYPSELGLVWKDLHSNHRRTFVFNYAELERFDVIRQTINLVHAHFRRGGSIEDLINHFPSPSAASIGDIKTSLQVAANARRKSPAPTAAAMGFPIRACTELILLLVLCAEISLFPERLIAFWNSVGIKSISERVKYTQEHFAFLFTEGPVLGIGAALSSQIRRKYESGNAFDCFHLAYLPHVSKIYTADAGLIAVGKDFPKSANFRRIGDAVEFKKLYLGPT